jgi:hypothetical protein
MQTFTLSHPTLDGPFVVDYAGTETGIRSHMTMHALRTFGALISTAAWTVTVEAAA